MRPQRSCKALLLFCLRGKARKTAVSGDGVADGLVGIESDADALDVVGGYALGLDGLSVGVVDGVGHVSSSGSVYALGLVVEVRGESGSEVSEVSELYGVSAQELFDDHLL